MIIHLCLACRQDMMTLFRFKLDPAVRCADDFTRFDAEFAAHHISRLNHCAY